MKFLHLFVFLALSVLVRAQTCSLSLCFAIDASSSITRFQFVKEIEDSSAFATSISTQFDTVYFSATTFSSVSSPILAPTTSLGALTSALSGIQFPSGYFTASGLGISQCATFNNEAPDANKVGIIVLLSDGVDTTSPRAVDVSTGDNVVVTVRLGKSDFGENVLQNVAENERLYLSSISDFNTEGFLAEVETAWSNKCLGQSYTPTPSITPSTTPSTTSSSTSSATPSSTTSSTPTPSISESSTPTPTSSTTSTASMIPTPSASTTSTATPTPSKSTSMAPTPSSSTTSTATPTPTKSASSTPSASPSPSNQCNTLRVCFALDESSSIKPRKFAGQIKAISEFSSVFAALSPGSSFSASTFAKEASVLSGLTNITSFTDALANNTQEGGPTSSGTGLLECAGILGSDPTPPGKDIIVLVTDGEDNLAPFGSAVAPQLKEAGFFVAAIGIGNFVSKKDLKAIASKPSLYKRFRNYAKFTAKVGALAQSFCSLPSEATPPLPTPSTSSTPSPMSLPTIISKSQISSFNVSMNSMYNAGALREAFEFYLSKKLGIQTPMRIDVYLESSAHPNFPWNIVNGKGDRFYWPGQTASPSPVIVSDDTIRMESMASTVRALTKCPLNDCAARVQIVAAKDIKYSEVRSAFNSIKKLPGFATVFSKIDKEKSRIIREDENAFVVFVAFVDRLSK